MKNELLSHSLATIEYRFMKAVGDQESDFGAFSLGAGTRTVSQIIHHMYEVLHATRIFLEEEKFMEQSSEVLDFRKEIMRFMEEVKLTNESLSTKELPVNYAKRLIQGPISDLFSHIGQVSMMSRVNGRPKDGEDFSAAPIGSFGNQ